jgi:hypothetical protein
MIAAACLAWGIDTSAIADGPVGTVAKRQSAAAVPISPVIGKGPPEARICRSRSEPEQRADTWP